MSKLKRVILYTRDEQYKKLRKTLLREHKTVSFWFREQVSIYLKSKEVENNETTEAVA